MYTIYIMVLASRRIPRELLVFSLCQNLKVITSGNECLISRVDELASEGEGPVSFYVDQKMWPRLR